MPEVRELTDALAELPMDPITGVGVVASRNRAPTSYEVVSQTTDGVDADLWKDGLFKSKVTRYLCFTRAFSKENLSFLSEERFNPLGAPELKGSCSLASCSMDTDGGSL